MNMSIYIVYILSTVNFLIKKYLNEDNFDGLGITVVSFGFEGLFWSLFVFVDADFIGDDFNGFCADGSGYGVALFDWDDELDWEYFWDTGLFEGWCAYFSGFDNIYDGAVMFWLFITISWSWVSVCWGMMDSMVDWGWASEGEGEESQQSKSLKLRTGISDIRIKETVMSGLAIYCSPYSQFRVIGACINVSMA